MDLAEINSLTAIQALTRQQGEAWAEPHVRRVLALAQQIAGGLAYDPPALEYAAWLHDWGAFPAFRLEDVPHQQRSHQLAAQILPHCPLQPEQVQAALEAIALHDYRDPRRPRSPEALLLREADCLDLMGAIGAARELAWGPNDLGRIVRRLHGRIEGLRGCLSLPAARQMAEVRLAEMEAFLANLESESLGFL
jgi:uncharacterized protein